MYDDHLRFIEKRVDDFLLVLIEFFSLGVTAEAPRTVNERQAAQVAALADRMSRLEVKHTNRESDVTTVEGAGLAIAEWPETEAFGFRPLGDRHLSRLRPSSRLIRGQFVSLLPATCAVCLVHSSGRVLPNNALTNT